MNSKLKAHLILIPLFTISVGTLVFYPILFFIAIVFAVMVGVVAVFYYIAYDAIVDHMESKKRKEENKRRNEEMKIHWDQVMGRTQKTDV